jgi:hypothetical protein
MFGSTLLVPASLSKQESAGQERAAEVRRRPERMKKSSTTNQVKSSHASRAYK